MAKEKANTKAKIISEFSKNASEIVRIGLSKYQGKELLDIRIWVIGNDGESYIATRKGISLRVDQIDDLKEAIDKAAKEIKKGE